MKTALFLTAPAVHRLNAIYADGRQVRGMSNGVARLYTVLVILAYALLRLEGEAWGRWRSRYGAWFAHITERPFQPADPIRAALQALWILFIPSPVKRKRSWPAVLRKKAESACTGFLTARRMLYGQMDATPKMVRSNAAVKQLVSAFRDLGKGTRVTLFLGLVILACVLAMLLITQPFNLYAQFIFVSLLWGMAMLVRHIPGRFSTLMLIVLSLTVSGRYMWWRYTATLNMSSGLDLLFGGLLLIAETYSWIVLVMGYVQTAWPLKRQPAALPLDTKIWPIIDLMIPTYNEDLSVVEPTVYAALGMDWPKDKLRIHLLDDGRRPAFRAFAEQAGINYIVRPDGRHAKAGNLNHALNKTDGELIAIFDCDHIPTRSFLQVTVGWFLKDSKLALVQTPHHFFSPDPFERNLGHFAEQPNENTLFYGLVQDGNDLWNAAFFCGSCAVLRRSAIAEIGGFAVETVTEDAHTALRLHRKGYNSAYLRVPQAAGLATETLSAHIGQRIRWARGMAQIFRTDNPLFGKGLSLLQRLCYVNAMLHFLSGVPRLIYLTAPLAFLLLHSYIVYAPAVAILLNVVPHMMHASLTNSHMQGSFRRLFWGEIYETALAWYIARPTTVALIAPSKGSFNVTAKGGLIKEQYFDWTISHPYVLLAFANVVGFGFGIWRLWTGPSHEIITVLITMLWVLYNLVILGGAIAVASEVRQVRHNHRVPSSLPVRLQLHGGYVYPGVLSDFSESGVGLTLKLQRQLRTGEKVSVLLSRGDRSFSFPGVVTRIAKDNIGIRFDTLTRQQHIDFVQCTFARADSWLAWQDRFKLDRPLQSLRDIVLMALNGYQRLGRYLPFPFDWALRSGIAMVAWVISFIPRRCPAPSLSENMV